MRQKFNNCKVSSWLSGLFLTLNLLGKSSGGIGNTSHSSVGSAANEGDVGSVLYGGGLLVFVLVRSHNNNEIKLVFLTFQDT